MNVTLNFTKMLTQIIPLIEGDTCSCERAVTCPGEHEEIYGTPVFCYAYAAGKIEILTEILELIKDDESAVITATNIMDDLLDNWDGRLDQCKEAVKKMTPLFDNKDAATNDAEEAFNKKTSQILHQIARHAVAYNSCTGDSKKEIEYKIKGLTEALEIMDVYFV